MAKSNKRNGRKRSGGGYRRGNKRAGRVIAITLLFVAALCLALYGLYVTGQDSVPDTGRVSAPASERAPDADKGKIKPEEAPPKKAVKTDKGAADKSRQAKKETPGPTRAEPARKEEEGQAAGYKPKVVIIVDDIGQHKEPIDRLLALEGPLTFAILPNLPYSGYAAEMAYKKGWDVILHLPMEPTESSGYTAADAGEDALLVGLSKDAILARLEENLASVPHVKGVNNHMGSKFMENEELMDLVLERMMAKGLYFVDSMTTARSVGYQRALDAGMKSAKRDVFLDLSTKGPGYVKSQMQKLVGISEKKGYAIGICHPYPDTIEALGEVLPEIRDRAELVNASDVVVSRKELSGL